MAAASFIGALISLTSNAGIRYEGILDSIDARQQTVTLKNVRSFGTETRSVPIYRPPSNEIYESVVFKGTDIKDLTIAEQKQSPQQEDPAILSAKKQTAPLPPPTHQRTQENPHSPHRNRNSKHQNNNHQHQQQHQNNSRSSQNRRTQKYTVRELSDNPTERRGSALPGVGSFLNAKPSSADVNVEEFDFASSNAKFNKDEFIATIQSNLIEQNGNENSIDEITQELKETNLEEGEIKDENNIPPPQPDELPAVKPVYNKSKSFFDDLDSSSNQQSSSISRRNLLRAQDVSTFGDEARQFKPHLIHSRRGNRRNNYNSLDNNNNYNRRHHHVQGSVGGGRWRNQQNHTSERDQTTFG